MDARDQADPLAPLDFGITALAWFVGVLLLIVVAATLFGSGSFLGLGRNEVCANTRPGAVPHSGDGREDVPGGDGIVGLKEGARSIPQVLEVCSADPSFAVKAGATIGPAAGMGLLVGSLLLTRRLIRQARRTRLFSAGVASRTKRLGWFLLAGSLLAAALQSLSDGIVLSTAVRGVSWTVGQDGFDLPLTLVLVGLGVISVGRVLDRAVRIQDDADATI